MIDWVFLEVVVKPLCNSRESGLISHHDFDWSVEYLLRIEYIVDFRVFE